MSNYPFLFLEKKHQRNKFESAYSDKPQLAVSGTKHTVTTPNGRILHRKMISEPISKVYQEQNNRNWAMRTGQPIYQLTFQTKTGDGDRIGQRVRDAINGHREPKDPRPTNDYNHQRLFRERLTKTGPQPKKYKLTTNNSSPHSWRSNDSRHEHDGHGSRPCHRRC